MAFADLTCPPGNLADHVRYWSDWVLDKARADLAPYYPAVDGKPTVAYLWARTVRCKNCRATIPLLKTTWLCNKSDKRVVLEIGIKSATEHTEDAEKPSAPSVLSALCGCHSFLRPHAQGRRKGRPGGRRRRHVSHRGDLPLLRGDHDRHVYHHYAGFARHQIRLLEAESPPQAKTLLYVYRVLLTGIWLLRTGQVEANLRHLNCHLSETFQLPFIPDLIAYKQAEHATLPADDLAFHRQTIAELQAQMEIAFQESKLPEEPENVAALDEFLVRLRLEGQK